MTKRNKSLGDVKINDLRRPELRNKVIYIRTTAKISKWMTQNNLSPSKLFNDCAEVIMQQNETSVKNISGKK